MPYSNCHTVTDTVTVTQYRGVFVSLIKELSDGNQKITQYITAFKVTYDDAYCVPHCLYVFTCRGDCYVGDVYY